MSKWILTVETDNGSKSKAYSTTLNKIVEFNGELPTVEEVEKLMSKYTILMMQKLQDEVEE